ncbi:calcium-binding protein [Octadecabacter sp. R77987]|uniref:calcium-binding protein n=1 Tax=Octadecabacter sp. R77987 TaxID=3093874 RepID=UPI003670C3C1
MTLYYSDGTLFGGAGDDYIVGHPSWGPHHLIYGGGGDDVIFGDYDFFFALTGGNSIANAYDLTASLGAWSTASNPDIGNDTIPHTSIYIEGDATPDYYSVTVVAGQTLTLDVDYGAGWGGSAATELSLIDSDGTTVIASSASTPGGTNEGNGDLSGGSDPYLTYTFASAGTYYLTLEQIAGNAPLGAGQNAVINVSLTGQAVSNGSPAPGDDILHGDAGNDTIYGGAGTDTLYGGDGDDYLHTDGNGDMLYGGAGDDIMDVSGTFNTSATAYGGDGNDTLMIDSFGSSATLDGGAGIDTIHMVGWLGGNVVVDLELGQLINFGVPSGASLPNFENLLSFTQIDADWGVRGTEGRNVIKMSGGTNVVEGRGGNDVLSGGIGNDELYGGTGDDTVNGGVGSDAVLGGDGDDVLRGQGDADEVSGGDGNDQLTGGTGDDFLFGNGDNDLILGQGDDDSINGGTGDDTIYGGSGNDNMTGGDGMDRLYGQGNNDTLDGAGGHDSLFGGAGFDDLQGGDGDDRLFGGNGADVLAGGAGNDTLSGGNGADDFVFALGDQADRINAFEVGLDDLMFDLALVGGTAPTDIAQFITDYATANGTGTILTFDFGGGDILELQNGGGFDLGTLAGDIGFY